MFFATPALCLRESFRQPFPIGKLASSATLNHVISHYLQKVGQYHKTVSHRAWACSVRSFQGFTFRLRENFLSEFRRRQRDELLRQPVWRICFERTQGFALQCTVGSLASYAAGIVAVVACAAVISIGIYQQPEHIQVAVESSPCQHTTSKCRKRIQPCASDLQRRADSSPRKQECSGAAG